MSKAKLFQKVAKVMARMEWIPKRGWNKFHGYEYVTEADLVDHVRKVLVEEGLVTFPNIKSYTITGEMAVAEVEFTLCDTETGESMTTVIVAEGMDKGDKKFPKLMASATKYYLMKTFLVPTGDDPEADVTTDERTEQRQPGPSHNKADFPNQQKSQGKNKVLSDKQLNSIRAIMRDLNKKAGTDDDYCITQLKQAVGNFESLESLPGWQASKAIDQLKTWLNGTPQM